MTSPVGLRGHALPQRTGVLVGDASVTVLEAVPLGTDAVLCRTVPAEAVGM